VFSGFALAWANNICIFPVHQCSKAAFTDVSYGSQTCCDWKNRCFDMLDQRRGEDVAEKRNPKHSSVNKLINNWHEYAKYYRTLILTRCSSLTRLIKNDQHGKRKHKRPKQHNLFPLLPFLCQCSVSLWPLGMMHPPLPVGCQRLGKVITGKQVINQGREKTQTYTDLLGNFVLTRRFM